MTLLPLFVRKFILDFVETAIAAILLLNLAFPTSLTGAEQGFVTVGVATFGALVSAIRRNAPDFVTWLAGKLGLSSS